MRFAHTIERPLGVWAFKLDPAKLEAKNLMFSKEATKLHLLDRRGIGISQATKRLLLILLMLGAWLIASAMQKTVCAKVRLDTTPTIFFGDMLAKDLITHILKWEGAGGSDPRDPASKCYPNGVHTVKGVTYCTFTKYASSLGITPVTHDRFLKMSNAEAVKFMEVFFKNAQANKFRKAIGYSMLEVSWQSSPTVAIKTLQVALNNIGKKVGIDGVLGPETIKAANLSNQRKLFDAFWKERMRWLGTLSTWPVYGKGWTNRKNDFVAKFRPSVLGPVVKYTALGAAAIFLYNEVRSSKV